MAWLERFASWVVLVLSLSVHEWAHAWMANRLGDDTARLLGRATLNPLAHLDLMGTVVCPLVGVPFGWAKPVPVEPLRFRADVSMTGGLVQVALAGPVSNLVLGAAVAMLLHLGGGFWGGPARQLLDQAIALNIALAVFNLLPVPPLDGSRVVDGLVPERLRPAWTRVQELAPLVIICVVVVVARVFFR